MSYALFFQKKKKRDDLGEVGNCARPSTCHRFGLWAAAVIHGSGDNQTKVTVTEKIGGQLRPLSFLWI